MFSSISEEPEQVLVPPLVRLNMLHVGRHYQWHLTKWGMDVWCPVDSCLMDILERMCCPD